MEVYIVCTWRTFIQLKTEHGLAGLTLPYLQTYKSKIFCAMFYGVLRIQIKDNPFFLFFYKLIVLSISSSDFVTQGGEEETEKSQPKYQCILRPHTLPTLSTHSKHTMVDNGQWWTMVDKGQ